MVRSWVVICSLLLAYGCSEDGAPPPDVQAGGSGGGGLPVGGSGGSVGQAPFCGDGMLDPGEDCDEGALNSDTRRNACRSDCTMPRCGDGVRDLDEQCDDGNDDDNDGCTSMCTILFCGDGALDPGEECDDGAANSDTAADACRTNCEEAGCGDGVLDAGEECDDGNRADFDGCSWDCKVQLCGNGVLDAGEECDEGIENSDGLANACRTNCTRASCGDGVRDSGEECDDANDDPTDGCNACVAVFCGDGIVQGFEECDDGELNSDTEPGACRTDCTASRCGDGVLDEGEECDDANVDPRDACAYCRFTFCGDGIIGHGEECDQGDRNSDSVPDACRTDCQLYRCGDGVIDHNENCEDGNTEDGDGCSSTCREEGDNCDAVLPIVATGTSFEVSSSTADYFDDFDLAACGTVTTPSKDMVYSFIPPASGKWIFSLAPSGFDGVLGVLNSCNHTPPAEEIRACMDSGSSGARERYTADLQAGDSLFLVVDGFGSTGQQGAFTLSGSVCGDGILQSAEECDDGNNVDGDGCSASCIEEGDTCQAPVPIVITNNAFNIDSTTSGMVNDYNQGTCTGFTTSNPDKVFRLVSPTARSWTINLVATFDSSLAVTKACATSPTWLACDDNLTSGGLETVTVDLLPGEQLFIVVGAFSGSGAFNLSGTSTAL